MSFDTYLLAFLTALAVSGVVISIERILEKQKEKNKQIQEIKKIKDLLNGEFSSLDEEYLKARSNFEKKWQKVNEEKKKDILEPGLLHDLIFGELSVDDFLYSQSIAFEFQLWNAVVSSGSLIKLETDEIKKTQNAHNSVTEYNNQIASLQNKIGTKLDELLVGKTLTEKQLLLPVIKNEIDNYFAKILEYWQDSYEDIETLKELSWITFKHVE